MPSDSNPYTLTDGKLITARWPGDAKRLGETLLERIQAEAAEGSAAFQRGSHTKIGMSRVVRVR